MSSAFALHRWAADAAAVAGAPGMRAMVGADVGATVGGPYQIDGVVQINGIPAIGIERPVFVFSTSTQPNTWSRPADGTYTVSGVPAGSYFVFSRDPTGEYDLVGHDAITAELP